MASSSNLFIPVKPTISFLLKGDQEKLIAIIKELTCSDFLRDMLKKYEATLSYVRSIQEISKFGLKLCGIENYLEFISVLIMYAGTQEMFVPLAITKDLDELKAELAELDKKGKEKEQQISTKDEAHRARASSQVLQKKTHIRHITHIRSDSNFSTLNKYFDQLTDLNEQLAEKMAKAANELIKHENDLILKVIFLQIDKLSRKDINTFSYFDVKIRNSKSINELDTYDKLIRKWLDQYDVLLLALTSSLKVSKMIGSIVSDLIYKHKIKHYPALDQNTADIKKYLPDASEALPVVIKLNLILGFLPKIEKMYTDRKEELQAPQPKDNPLKMHERERSKSLAMILPPGVKYKFFTSNLRKNASEPHSLPRQTSAMLPTKWRVKDKDEKNKRKSMGPNV